MLPVAQAPDLNTDRRAVERGEFEASKIKSFRFIVKYHPGEEKREGFEGRSCQSFGDEAEARGGDARSKKFYTLYNVQGGFFNWSALKMTKCQTLRKF